MKNILKLIRIKHYIKNLLIFIPLIFNGSLFDVFKLRTAFIGWMAYSFSASAVYVFNDIRDRKQDQIHPVKCQRPIACGEVSVNQAWVLMISMLLLAFCTSSLTFRGGGVFLSYPVCSA